MPMEAGAREPLKDGLVTHKDECCSFHPVERIMENSDCSARTSLQANVYGSALTARAAIEQQILSRCGYFKGCLLFFIVGTVTNMFSYIMQD